LVYKAVSLLPQFQQSLLLPVCCLYVVTLAIEALVLRRSATTPSGTIPRRSPRSFLFGVLMAIPSFLTEDVIYWAGPKSTLSTNFKAIATLSEATGLHLLPCREEFQLQRVLDCVLAQTPSWPHAHQCIYAYSELLIRRLFF
jgi:hypothetical protein